MLSNPGGGASRLIPSRPALSPKRVGGCQGTRRGSLLGWRQGAPIWVLIRPSLGLGWVSCQRAERVGLLVGDPHPSQCEPYVGWRGSLLWKTGLCFVFVFLFLPRVVNKHPSARLKSRPAELLSRQDCLCGVDSFRSCSSVFKAAVVLMQILLNAYFVNPRIKLDFHSCFCVFLLLSTNK